MQAEIRGPSDFGRRLIPGIAAVLLGAALAYNPTFGFIVFGLLSMAIALALPTSVLIGAALVSAIGLRALVTIGWVPAVAGFADIPLAWLALAVTLIRHQQTNSIARRILALVVALLACVMLAWLANPSEVVRPFLYAALVGEPFAMIAAILLAAPSPQAHRGLVVTIYVLLAIQVPIGIYQAITVGIGDPVAGTLYGAGAGPHVLGGCLALGILFCLASRHRARFIAIGVLALVLFLADPKQVFVALVPALFVMRFVTAKRFRLLSVVAVGVVAVPLLLSLPGLYLRWSQLRSADTGKSVAVAMLAEDLDASTILVGRGPAETVSRSAYMTTDFHLREDSPLRSFGLHPAEIATDAYNRSLSLGLYSINSSVNSSLSSALGVFGDIGLLGFVMLGLLIFAILREAYRHLYGSAVMGAWTMYVILGFIYDWWEQPPFTVLLAVLTGLALTSQGSSQKSCPDADTRMG